MGCTMIDVRDGGRATVLGVNQAFSSSSVPVGSGVTGKNGRARNNLCAVVMAMVGHDLRQPLQVITGSHELLTRMLSCGKQQAELARAVDATTEVASMLGQLVGILSLNDGFGCPHHEPVALRPMLSELAAEFAAPAARKAIELRVRPTTGVVASHPVLLSGILRNLIRNAIDYTPCGGRVLVACRRRGVEMHIEVRDSGPGIAAAELDKIFEAFHRTNSTRADGLGLGLFIVRHASLVLGHRVEVRSAAGRGSCFAVVAKRPFARHEVDSISQMSK